MAMVGCREVGIDEPQGCKKLVVYVEMDRCATDAVQAVTGCSLGKRTLKFLDYGKMAATFVNTETEQAIRVLARDDARALAPLYVQDAANSREAQKRIMPEDALFVVKPVSVEIPAREMPGYRGERVQVRPVRRGNKLSSRRAVRRPHALHPLRSRRSPRQWKRRQGDPDAAENSARRRLQESR